MFSQEKLKFSITEFAVDPFDYSARDPECEEYDGNGDRYAIIKVTSSNPDDKLSEYVFNFGNMRHFVKEHDGVLWVYVQRNAKLVTITREGYAPILKYNLHATLESGNNYVMKLNSESKRIYLQMVKFEVTPKDSRAIVMVKSNRLDSQEELFGQVDNTGSVAKNLQYGTYTYKIMADNYHTAEGRIVVNDKSSTLDEKVNLQPNYSKITLRVDADAEIYVNGECVGTREWTGTLKAGHYQVECRQEGHTESSQFITVADNEDLIVSLKLPQPIMGTASIISTPLGANIIIDGKEYGETPKNVDLKIGGHVLNLEKSGYKSASKTFEIKEGEITDLNLSLKSVWANSTKAAGNDLDNISSETTPRQTINETSKKRKIDYYLETGMQLGSSMSIPVSIGMYVHNFNFEIGYKIPISNPKIYWHYNRVVESYLSDFYNAECNYKPKFNANVKIGYGLSLSNRIILTPQIGYQFSQFSEKTADSEGYIKKAICASLVVGLRTAWQVTPRFGVSITPEYDIKVVGTRGYDALSNVSSCIKGFCEGFSAKIAVFINV